MISIGGNLTISGAAGNRCIWNGPDIDTLGGSGVAHYCDVYSSVNSSGNPIDASDNCFDGGGNIGWTFGAPPVGIPIYIGGTQITDVSIGSTPITAIYRGSTQIWPPP